MHFEPLSAAIGRASLTARSCLGNWPLFASVPVTLGSRDGRTVLEGHEALRSYPRAERIGLGWDYSAAKNQLRALGPLLKRTLALYRVSGERKFG